MLNFGSPTLLTPEQIAYLQQLEGQLGRLIFYSDFHQELRHKLFRYQDEINKYKSFSEIANDLLGRILYVNRYNTNTSHPKRIPSEISTASTSCDDVSDNFKRLCIRTASTPPLSSIPNSQRAKRSQCEKPIQPPMPSCSSANANDEPGAQSASSKRFRK